MQLVGFRFMVMQVPVLQGCDFPGGLEAFAPFFLTVLSGPTWGSKNFGKGCALAEATTPLLWTAWCSHGAKQPLRNTCKMSSAGQDIDGWTLGSTVLVVQPLLSAFSSGSVPMPG